jgi:hypothetical protein
VFIVAPFGVDFHFAVDVAQVPGERDSDRSGGSGDRAGDGAGQGWPGGDAGPDGLGVAVADRAASVFFGEEPDPAGPAPGAVDLASVDPGRGVHRRGQQVPQGQAPGAVQAGPAHHHVIELGVYRGGLPEAAEPGPEHHRIDQGPGLLAVVLASAVEADPHSFLSALLGLSVAVPAVAFGGLVLGLLGAACYLGFGLFRVLVLAGHRGACAPVQAVVPAAFTVGHQLPPDLVLVSFW